uniref:Uncharacterized protein n=1 Tax=Callithrix jacchus TaxID=9483 RepID=A0A8I3WN08_CALJA
MWPQPHNPPQPHVPLQPHFPPHPEMAKETRESKWAEAKEKLREYHQHNSPGVSTGATDTKREINNGSNPETTTSAGCHSPEDENRPSHHHQAVLRRQVEAQAHTIGALERALYFSENAARQLEGDCRYLFGCLQHASQHVEDLKQALSDVSTWKKVVDRVSPTTCPIPWQSGFPDGGVMVKVPSAGWSVLPRRQHGPFLGASVCDC